MMYLTTLGHKFDFSGWSEGDSPLDHFDAGRWLQCSHGACFMLGHINHECIRADAMEDDGLLHELIHLALGIDICTHRAIEDLRRELTLLMDEFEGQFFAPKPNGAADGSNPIRLVGSIPTGAAIYIDDATGRQVTEDWWPGDPWPEVSCLHSSENAQRGYVKSCNHKLRNQP